MCVCELNQCPHATTLVCASAFAWEESKGKKYME